MAKLEQLRKDRQRLLREVGTAVNTINSIPYKEAVANKSEAQEIKDAGKEATKAIDKAMENLGKVDYAKNFGFGSMVVAFKTAFRLVLTEGLAKFTAMRGLANQAPFVRLVDEDGRDINFEKLFLGLTQAVRNANLGAVRKKDTFASEISNETPTGSVNSSNKVFTLAGVPLTGKLKLYVNGMRQKLTDDYSISGATITFVIAPPTDSIILADYSK